VEGSVREETERMRDFREDRREVVELFLNLRYYGKVEGEWRTILH
jgi:hypothetical protein